MELTTMKTLRSMEQIARGLIPLMREREPLRLTRADVAAFDRARHLGYLVSRGEASRIYELWYAWCYVNQQPFVAICCRRRRAFIELELRDRSTELSDEGLALLDRTLREFSPARAGFCRGVGRRACTHTDVPNDRVETLARELLCIATDHLRPVQP